MKKRTIKRSIAIGALALPLLCGTPAVAIAQQAVQPDAVQVGTDESIEPYANTGDSGFKFNMATKNNTSATSYRRKEDKSSVYVYIKSRSGAARMFVDGANDANGAGSRDCTSTTYRARKTGKYRMRSNVYEWGYRHARLTAWGETGAAKVSGVWSPDSKYTYQEMGD